MKFPKKQTEKRYCPHCDPHVAHPAHLPERVLSKLSVLLLISKPIQKFFKLSHKNEKILNKVLLHGSIKFLLTLRILQETEVVSSDHRFYNRSLVIIEEARRRGITIRSIDFLGKKVTGIFSITHDDKRKTFFDGLPYMGIDDVSVVDFTDKGTLKKLFEGKNVPYPAGKVFSDYKKSWRYIKAEIGFPVVVKPRHGSLSRHTVCNIKNNDELRDAINIVQRISHEFLVEKFIPGSVYRVTMVDGKVAAACRREPPHVVGDGIHTIKELVEFKNQHPWRGGRDQKNYTLHKISLGTKAYQLLDEQGFSADSVLEKGKKIFLHDKVVLSCGADIHDVTDVIHPENIALFQNIYHVCKASVVGIDIIMSDISIPYHTQNSAVIEINSLPYIDMHHYPVTGKSRNVAGDILDFCFEEKL